MVESTAVVALIIGLSELSKKYISTKYTPLVSLILGIIGAVFFIPGQSLTESIFTGIAIGLSASGLYDMSKVVKK